MRVVHVLAECRAHLFGEVLSDNLEKKTFNIALTHI